MALLMSLAIVRYRAFGFIVSFIVSYIYDNTYVTRHIGVGTLAGHRL